MKHLIYLLSLITSLSFAAEPNRISKNSDFSLGRTGWSYTGTTSVDNTLNGQALGIKQSLSWQGTAGQFLKSPRALFKPTTDKTCVASIDYTTSITNYSNFYLTIVDATDTELITSSNRVTAIEDINKVKTLKLLFPCSSVPLTGVFLKLVATGQVGIGLGNAFIGVADFGTVPSITDWQEFTVTAGASATIRATTTAPTFGTVDTNKAKWRRVGSNLEIQWDYRQTAAGSAGSGAYLFNISQLGLKIDTSKVKASTAVSQVADFGHGKVGYFSGTDNSGRTEGGVFVYDDSNLKISYIFTVNATSVGGFNVWGSGGMQFSNSSQVINVHFSVPIVGWSSSETVTNARCPTDKDCENQFTAKGSSTGVVTDDTLDFINGNCTNANPSVCTFNTGFFTVAPNCPGSSAVTSTTVSYPNTTGFTVSCFKAPADYKPKQVIQGQISNTVYSDTGTKMYSARIAGATDTTPCTTSTCTIYRQTTGFLNSVTLSSGNYTLNFTAGTFSETPKCYFTGSNNLNVLTYTLMSSSNTTYVIASRRSSTEATTDSYFDVMCTGK